MIENKELFTKIDISTTLLFNISYLILCLDRKTLMFYIFNTNSKWPFETPTRCLLL